MNGQNPHPDRSDHDPTDLPPEVIALEQLLDRLGEVEQSRAGLADRVFDASAPMLPVPKAVPMVETTVVESVRPARTSRRGFALAACMALVFFGGMRLLSVGSTGQDTLMTNADTGADAGNAASWTWVVPPTPISDPATERHDLEVVFAESVIDISGLRYDDLEGELEVFENVLASR